MCIWIDAFKCGVLLVALLVGAWGESDTQPPVGIRRPPYPLGKQNKHDCDSTYVCAGPKHDHYPFGRLPGIIFTSHFVVPELPKIHVPNNMTYYDYFNIFWRQHQSEGYINQFVPQLMLGNVLANSTNFPEYDPLWKVLDTWHIGSQYFFSLPKDSCITKPCWIPKAATGKLVPVKVGEIVETTFLLVNDGQNWEWHLRMGVVGEHPNRWSLVVVPNPYMGLVSNTTWKDETYENVTIGSCLENYGLESASNYFPSWQTTMDTILPSTHKTTDWSPPSKPSKTERSKTEKDGHMEEMFDRVHTETGSFAWDDWEMGGAPNSHDKCSWIPSSTLSWNNGNTWQRVFWNATLHGTTRMKNGALSE